MNQTGWPVQIFHGPTNGPQLRHLFAAQIGTKVAMAKGRAARPSLTLTDLGDDYMEDWVRLSSMMLLDVFWRATLGEKVLVFQPDHVNPNPNPNPNPSPNPNANPTNPNPNQVLVFQPDTIMCPGATRRMDDFLQYDFVGPPMGGARCSTSHLVGVISS